MKPILMNRVLVLFGATGLAGALAAALVVGCSSSSGLSAGPPFTCGSIHCTSGTQYCQVVMGGADAAPSTTCGSFPMTCTASSCACLGYGQTAKKPEQCGCYQSASGEVTLTECVP